MVFYYVITVILEQLLVLLLKSLSQRYAVKNLSQKSPGDAFSAVRGVWDKNGITVAG